MSCPKIELHVHLEGAVRPDTLFDLARRNGLELPAETPEQLAELYRFRDFDHFIRVWIMTTNVLRHADDFRRITVDYAAEAASHGAVYVEAIFSPIERTWRGVGWDELYTGYCDGAQEARELHGVELRLTPDITRAASLEDAELSVEYAARYRDRGVVAVGLGGEEALYATELFERPFARAREAGLGSVPHAGEVAGPESIRAALDVLHADRIRHGIRAVEDPALLGELADRGIVLDVTPDLERAHGRCGLARGAPASAARGGRRPLLDLDRRPGDVRHRPHARVRGGGASSASTRASAYEAGVAGALCDEATRERLSAIGASFDWAAGCAAV